MLRNLAAALGLTDEQTAELIGEASNAATFEVQAEGGRVRLLTETFTTEFMARSPQPETMPVFDR
jgi:hypothetical protein